MKNKFFYLLFIPFFLLLFFYKKNFTDQTMPLVAIANYGPHASLHATIKGFKEQMEKEGFIEGKNITYIIQDVSFQPMLVPQMIQTLRSNHPKIMIVLTTPVAQAAKGKIKDIPVIYSAITDPIEAGLISHKNQSQGNITGSSDQQDLGLFLKFALTLLPKAKKIGLLYATSESNDTALVSMMRAAAMKAHMEVIAIPIDEPQDIPLRMQALRKKVDFIYVGTSGPIQPSLPVIVSQARQMNIPVFNVEDQAVRDGITLASFGVNYLSIGRHAGKLAAAFLRGKPIKELAPLYPTPGDHHGVINKKIMHSFNIPMPENLLPGTEILE